MGNRRWTKRVRLYGHDDSTVRPNTEYLLVPDQSIIADCLVTATKNGYGTMLLERSLLRRPVVS